MSETERIARLLEQTFEGKAYYGPSVMATLEDVTVDEATQKPCDSAHTILEIVLHLAAELIYASAVIEGTAGHWDDSSTWLDAGDASEDTWKRAVEGLKRANRSLVHAVMGLDDAILDKKPVRVMGPYYVMLHGTIQHSVFHAGEISLLCGQLRLAGRGSEIVETE